MRALGDARRDLERLAEHLPTILGRAQNLDATTTVAPTGGRPDSVDERHEGLASALRIMQRLAAVAWAPRRVLVYVYLMTGPEARERTAGFTTRVGLVFATPHQRLAWLMTPAKSLGMGAAQKFGEQVLESAVNEYAAVSESRDLSDGRWLPADMDHVTRMDAFTARTIRDLSRVREMNRCKPAPGAPKNRKERRAAQSKPAALAASASKKLVVGKVGSHPLFCERGTPS